MGGKKKTTKKNKVVVQNVTALPWYAPVQNKLKGKTREFVTGMTALIVVLLIPISLLAKGYPQTQKEFTVKKAAPQVEGVKTKKQTVTPTPTKTAEKKYYIVMQNEYLWQIAEKVYGDGNLYTRLLELNYIPNPNNIEAGTRLVLE